MRNNLTWEFQNGRVKSVPKCVKRKVFQLESSEWFHKYRTLCFLSKCTENFYGTGNNIYNELTNLYKMTVSFMLSNADFLTLPLFLSHI